jgi:hypothetical protein
MKTAEEWKQIWWSWPMPDNSGEYEGQQEFLKLVPQIQLDAMKEGMRRAAELADNPVRLEPGYSHLTQQNIKQAILTAAEQLTEKDL